MTTTTSTNTNTDTVAAIYAAFGRGDLPAILDTLADDVAWERWDVVNYAQRAGVAHLAQRRGPAQVAEFFQIIAGWTPNAFEVRDVIGTGRQIVAEVALDFSLPNGGRLVEEDLHLWTFDDTGRVVAFRHYCDTAKHIAAAAGEDTSGDRSRVVGAIP